jgi:hypothetical protein
MGDINLKNKLRYFVSAAVLAAAMAIYCVKCDAPENKAVTKSVEEKTTSKPKKEKKKIERPTIDDLANSHYFKIYEKNCSKYPDYILLGMNFPNTLSPTIERNPADPSSAEGFCRHMYDNHGIRRLMITDLPPEIVTEYNLRRKIQIPGREENAEWNKAFERILNKRKWELVDAHNPKISDKLYQETIEIFLIHKQLQEKFNNACLEAYRELTVWRDNKPIFPDSDMLNSFLLNTIQGDLVDSRQRVNSLLTKERTERIYNLIADNIRYLKEQVTKSDKKPVIIILDQSYLPTSYHVFKDLQYVSLLPHGSKSPEPLSPESIQKEYEIMPEDSPIVSIPKISVDVKTREINFSSQ